MFIVYFHTKFQVINYIGSLAIAIKPSAKNCRTANILSSYILQKLPYKKLHIYRRSIGIHNINTLYVYGAALVSLSPQEYARLQCSY
jgi:hypothetical protein